MNRLKKFITPKPKIQKKRNETDYSAYQMTPKETLLNYSLGIGLLLMVSVLFYNNILIGLLCSPLSYYFVKLRKKDYLERQKQELSNQFKDGIYALSAALNAGYSVEMAFKEATKDLKIIYLDPKTPIRREFEHMVHQIEMNQPVEAVLEAFASKTQIEDIKNFSDVFTTCKRTGGDLLKVIRDTSKTIAEKIEIKREIQLLISQKKFEQKIMSLIPFGIILYLWVSSPGFLDVMYRTFMGTVVMTGCLILYIFSYMWSKRIMKIEV